MPDDDYPTCARTYATLRIYPGEIDPTEVTGRLGIEPSSWQRRGGLSHWAFGWVDSVCVRRAGLERSSSQKSKEGRSRPRAW